MESKQFLVCFHSVANNTCRKFQVPAETLEEAYRIKDLLLFQEKLLKEVKITDVIPATVWIMTYTEDGYVDFEEIDAPGGNSDICDYLNEFLA